MILLFEQLPSCFVGMPSAIAASGDAAVELMPPRLCDALGEQTRDRRGGREGDLQRDSLANDALRRHQDVELAEQIKPVAGPRNHRQDLVSVEV